MFPTEPVVALLDRQSLELDRSGKRKICKRIVYDVRQPGESAARTEGFWQTFYRKLDSFQGWTVSPDGKERFFSNLVTQQGPEATAFSDSWFEALDITGLIPSDLVAVEL